MGQPYSARRHRIENFLNDPLSKKTVLPDGASGPGSSLCTKSLSICARLFRVSTDLATGLETKAPLRDSDPTLSLIFLGFVHVLCHLGDGPSLSVAPSRSRWLGSSEQLVWHNFSSRHGAGRCRCWRRTWAARREWLLERDAVVIVWCIWSGHVL